MTTKKKTRVSMNDTLSLSRLPDQILDRILCFLSQKEAVRTSVLSKSWRHLGPSRSKLELCHVTDFNGRRGKFLSVMHNSIRRYNHHHPLKELSLKLSSATVRLDLPWVSSEAPLLEELYLERWNLRGILRDHESRPVFNHLRKLSLVGCNFKEEKLKVLLSSEIHPLLEWLCIAHISNLNIGRLKHLEVSDASSIQVDDTSTLETIHIADCLKWCLLGNNYFPRLKSLCLTRVGLSPEVIGFFASNYMPSLEKLELERCYGCEIFQLSSSSIKYLSIINFLRAKMVTIDSPNISCFKFKAYLPVPLISFTPISSEWESHLDLRFDILYYRRKVTPGIHEIHHVLKSLSQSKITLKLFFCKKYQRRIVQTNHAVLHHQKPLVVERLTLEFGDCSYSTVQVIVNYLFRVCRPRYIYNDAKVLQDSRELAEILWKVLLPKRDYLAEVGMESSSCDMNPKEWRSVPGNSLSECDNQNIRFRLKWRGMD